MKIIMEVIKGKFNDFLLIICPLTILGQKFKPISHPLENVQPYSVFYTTWMTLESLGVLNEGKESWIDKLGDGCIQIPGL